MDDEPLPAAVDGNAPGASSTVFGNNKSTNQTSTPNIKVSDEQLTTVGRSSRSKSSKSNQLLTSKETLKEDTVKVKRRRTTISKADEPEASSKTAQRRERGSKLSELPSMPLDILLEIFRQLPPSDLIKLARMNKDLRRLLLNRSTSLSVWKDSLRQVQGLPEGPPGMSEIAWADLVFSAHCQYCAARTSNIDWAFRQRICNKCSKEKLVDPYRYDIPKTCRKKILDNDNFRALDYATRNSIIPMQRNKHGKLQCLKSDYNAVKAEYNQLNTPEQCQAYILKRKELVQEIQKHAQACVAWEDAQIQTRKDECRRLKEERKAAIISKLEDLGWGTELKSIKSQDSFEKHKLVNRPQLLTDKIWGHIRSEIIEYIEQMKVKRLEREYKALKLKRKGFAMDGVRAFKKSHHPGQQYFPEPADYCKFPRIQEKVDLPADVEVDASSFTDVVNDLPGIFADWIRGVEPKLGEVVRQVLNREEVIYDYEDAFMEARVKIGTCPGAGLTVEGGVEKLKLASTVLVCKACEPPDDRQLLVVDCTRRPPSRPLFYPQVLGHLPCLTRDRRGHFLEDSSSGDSDPSTYLGCSSARWPWNCWPICCDMRLSKNAEIVVKEAGLDPVTATSGDMDQLNIRLLCQKCMDDRRAENAKVQKEDQAGGPSQQPVEVGLFEWRAMTRHLTDQFHGGAEVSLIKVNVNELSDDVIAAENALRLKLIPQWSCMHCIDTSTEKDPLPFSMLKVHFSTTHPTINSPVLNEDYFEHFSAPNIRAYHRPLWVHWNGGNISLIPSQINTDGGDLPRDCNSYRVPFFPDYAEIDHYDGVKHIPADDHTDYGYNDYDDDW